MTRRRWLFVTGGIALALAIALLAVDPSRKGDGYPGILAWEFAWTEERAAEILGEWGTEGTDAARLSLRLDFAYLLAYGAFLVLATAATRDLAVARGWPRMASFGQAAMACAVGGALFDALEDVFLLLALEREAGDLAPRLGASFASVKFLLLAIAIAYLLIGLALRLGDRRRSAGA